jgi:ribose 5-phosphate isomerase B
MTTINEQEIKQIVSRVVEQALGSKKAVSAQDQSSDTTKNDPNPEKSTSLNHKTVAIGADHGGFNLKELLKQYMTGKGYEVIDCGTKDTSSVDYPDFAAAVATLVSSGTAWRGVMIDGAGIGSCITANKVPGVRAAMCYDYATAVNSREHNDANLLTLGAGLIGENQAKLILETWLQTEFGGGRHARRVNKIIEVEQRYLKGGS